MKERERERETGNCDATRDSIRVACGRAREREREREREGKREGETLRKQDRALLLAQPPALLDLERDPQATKRKTMENVLFFGNDKILPRR